VDFERITHLILSGVGSFGATMNPLNQRNLVQPIRDSVLSGEVLFMEICVDMQVLATSDLEFEEHEDFTRLIWTHFIFWPRPTPKFQRWEKS
jgi:imidazoleglycerol phosphate synthase glutamine amidotransferase subunit HisH